MKYDSRKCYGYLFLNVDSNAWRANINMEDIQDFFEQSTKDAFSLAISLRSITTFSDSIRVSCFASFSRIYPLPSISAFPPFQSHGFNSFMASLSSLFSFGASVPHQIGVATCKSSDSLPLHELLLLSPSPNPRTSKTRLAYLFEMPDEFGPLCALPNFIYNE